MEDLADIATIVASLLAILSLLAVAIQLRQQTKISNGEFLLHLEQESRIHEDVHFYLRPGGKWHGATGGPENGREWAAVEDYMGFFEHCEILMRYGVLREEDFRALFEYRLRNIWSSETIVETKLRVDGRKYWENFLLVSRRIGLSIPDRNRNG